MPRKKKVDEFIFLSSNPETLLVPEETHEADPAECVVPVVFICDHGMGEFSSVGMFRSPEGELTPLVFRMPYQANFKVEDFVEKFTGFANTRMYPRKDMTIIAVDNWAPPANESQPKGSCEDEECHSCMGSTSEFVDEQRKKSSSIVLYVCNSMISLPLSDGCPVYCHYVVVPSEFNSGDGKVTWFSAKDVGKLYNCKSSTSRLSLLASILTGEAVFMEFGIELGKK
jgi:hypothetical protein